MGSIDPVELAIEVKAALTADAIMSMKIKLMIEEAVDDASPIMEPSMQDMSRETSDFLFECMKVGRRADVALHTVDMHRFLAHQEERSRSTAEMLATPVADE